MNIFLSAGSNSPLTGMLEKSGTINIACTAETLENAVDLLEDTSIIFDLMLITDHGTGSNTDVFQSALTKIMPFVENKKTIGGVLFITKRPDFEQTFISTCPDSLRYKAILTVDSKVPVSQITASCLDMYKLINNPVNSFLHTDNQKEKESKKSSKKNLIFKVDNQLVSGNIHKTIAVTGHRGSGITSTVSNIAMEASSLNLKTFIIDFDIVHRNINLYFHEFGEAVDSDYEMATSLIKCLVKPSSYDYSSCMINKNLYLTTLSYSISNNDKLLEHINLDRVIGLITALKQRFNVVIIDAPLSFIGSNDGILLHVDSIGLCMSNNLYSIINTQKEVEEFLSSDSLSMLSMKSKAIITKYNEKNKHQGKSLTPELTCKILQSIGDAFYPQPELCGIIPYNSDFEKQTDTGKKISTVNREYKNLYTNILKNLL